MTADRSLEQRPPAQKLKYMLLASLSLAIGAWLSVQIIRADLFLLRAQRFGWWEFSDTVLRCALVAFLIWWGAGTLRRSGEASPGAGFGWGKFLLGLVIIYGPVKALFVPQQSFFSPGTSVGTAKLDGITITMGLIGVALIMAAFFDKWAKRQRRIQVHRPFDQAS